MAILAILLNMLIVCSFNVASVMKNITKEIPFSDKNRIASCVNVAMYD